MTEIRDVCQKFEVSLLLQKFRCRRSLYLRATELNCSRLEVFKMKDFMNPWIDWIEILKRCRYRRVVEGVIYNLLRYCVKKERMSKAKLAKNLSDTW